MTCCYLPGLYQIIMFDDTDTQECEQLGQSCYAAALDRKSNSRFRDNKSDALPLSQHNTQTILAIDLYDIVAVKANAH